MSCRILLVVVPHSLLETTGDITSRIKEVHHPWVSVCSSSCQLSTSASQWVSRERKKVSHLADLRLSCVQILQTLTIVVRTTGVFPTVILNAIVQTAGGATINNLCQGGQSDQTNFDGLSGVHSPNDGGGQRREVQVKDVVVLLTN